MFAIDTDGVVSVSAKDLGTGKSQSIEVTASSGLEEAEVERLVQEAVGNAAADQALRALIELRNKADGLMYSATKTLEEFAEDVDQADAVAISAQIEATRAQLGGEDPEALENALQELSRLSYGLTEKLYSALGGGEEDDEASSGDAPD
jgi:molecular chaperone DnaK